MLKNKTLFWLSTLPVLLILTACSGTDAKRLELKSKNSQNPKDYSQTLYSYASAYNIVYYKMGVSDQVSYFVKEDYPAELFLSNLSTYLSKMDYTPLKEDFMNPGISSSNVKGWDYFIDATQSPERKIKQWIGGWQGKDESIVRCMLRYDNPKNGGENNTELKVVIIYLSAASAKSTKESAINFANQQRSK